METKVKKKRVRSESGDAPLSVHAAADTLAPRPGGFVSNAQVMTLNCNNRSPVTFPRTQLPHAKFSAPVSIIGPASPALKKQSTTSVNNSDGGVKTLTNILNDNFAMLPHFGVKTYKVLHRGGFILHIKKDQKFQITGYADITVLYGGFRVFGADLGFESRKFIQVYADNRAFVAETNPFISSSLNDFKCNLRANNILVEESTLLKVDIKPGDAILFVEKLVLPNIFNAKHYLSPYTLPKPERLLSLLAPEVTQSMPFVVEEIGGRGISTFSIPPDWYSLPLKGKTVVIGGKGLGKSTLLKYLLNRQLNHHGAVLWMEFDLGQGEFIPPGSVGFSILTQPVLGPNYSHCTPVHPVRMVHLGCVDVNRCSTQYVAAVQLLVQLAIEDYGSIPWLVNTMGYTKGLGLHLNTAVIKAVCPQSVIQIVGPSPNNNFKSELTCTKLNRYKGQVFPWSGEGRDSDVHYDLIVINTAVTSKNNETGMKNRNMMLLTYLGAMLTAPSYYFHCIQPYSISFGNLYIGISSKIVPEDILAAINASLVNLTVFDATNADGFDRLEVKQSPGSCFRVILNPPVLLSKGLGIVRGIDTVAKELYLITPIPRHELANVNMLTISQVCLPPEIFLNQDGVDGEVPYTTKNTDDRAMATIQRLFIAPRKGTATAAAACH